RAEAIAQRRRLIDEPRVQTTVGELPPRVAKPAWRPARWGTDGVGRVSTVLDRRVLVVEHGPERTHEEIEPRVRPPDAGELVRVENEIARGRIEHHRAPRRHALHECVAEGHRPRWWVRV